ncbi:MAG: LamG-like jellyroll fold domain-containing protein [Phycisphaerales bacterium]
MEEIVMLFNKLVIISSMFVLFLFTGNPLDAATYYVSTTGNDTTGNGSIDTPWQTINKGQSMLAPGDILLVRGGRYCESVTLTKNGAVGNPITIKAYPNEIPILDGTESVTGWEQCTANETFLTVQGVINPNYANIYKVKIHSSKLPKDINKFMLFENGIHSRIARWPNQTVGYGIDMTLFNSVAPEAYGQKNYLLDSTRLTQADNYWVGAWIDILSHAANAWIIRRTIASNSQSAHTITFDTPLTSAISYGTTPDSYCIVNHPHTLDSVGEFAHTMTVNAEGYYTFYLWPIETDNLTANITTPLKTYGFDKYNANYITIDGFKFLGYTLDGVNFTKNAPYGAQGLVVRNCTIEDCGGCGIRFSGADNSTIEYCSISRVGSRGVLMNDGTNCKIQYCDINDTGSSNASFYTMTYSQLIGNTFRGCVGAHGNGSACYINCDKILIASNYYPSANLALQDIKNVIIYANVFDYEEMYSSIVATWSDSSGRTQEYQMYLHNTILGSQNNNSLGLKGQISSPFPQNYVINNIIDGCNSWDENQVLDMSYNFYTGYGWRQSIKYNWVLGAGEIDGRNLKLNQIFTNPGQVNGGDYTLTANSPAICTGKNIMPILIATGVIDPKNDNNSWFPGFDFTKDKAGNPWKSTPSMGAYEYTGISTKTSTEYTLNVQTRNCSVTKTPDKTSYESGEEVILTVKPLTGYHFSTWSGDASGTDASITITMDSNNTVSAICIPNPTEGQVFHAPLDDGSGTTVTDANNIQTGNLIGGPLWGVEWRDEDWLGFNQSTQAITIPTMGMSPQTGTIAVWVEPKDFSGMKFIFGHVLNNANRLSLYTVAGSLAVGLGANATLKTNIANLSLNQPVHLALSWNGTAYAVYVNGVQKAAGTFGGLTALNTFIDIGNYGDPVFRSLGFAGNIDDIRTYNRALAAEEIDALFYTHDVRQGKELQFTVNAVNAQGIPIVYQAAAMPAGANFNAATQSVTWTPWHNQLGLHTFRFTAAGQAEKLVTVEVHPAEETSYYSQFYNYCRESGQIIRN